MQSKYVIVGGGAGGLELACKLGRKLGPGKVMLVDSRLYHIWKPSLHEVAAGSLDIHAEGLSYQMLAHDNHFTYVYGAFEALDAPARTISVGPIETPAGETVLPARTIAYESLVLAVGSTSNYFGVPGAAENTISLNGTEDAERFRLTLLKLLAKAANKRAGQGAEQGVDIVIIGGGATGVELAAELREASGVYAAYGFGDLKPLRDVRISIIEGAPRILAPLPERVSIAAAGLLAERGVRVLTDTRVTEIGPDHVAVLKGDVYPADIVVWAAGIKAPDFLKNLGLPTVKGGHLDVTGELVVKGFPDIYALGDCAQCIGADGKPVPPRAQAAHQQADYLLETLLRRERGKSPQGKPYEYRDYGSLVSFGQRESVGSLMGSLQGKNWFVEGFFARMMYTSLHLMHHQAIMGTLRTGVLALARFLIKRSTPMVKLH
ncbi:NAD(P)/FAD-dependent oxidoreductase [Massilia dura]|uniref:NAD(P)/FAD-dependent oxidoreductase n=1 Tax=Pseudoduganella dura TaxID=321982 RepID=A0A6I3X2X7_9BURK|nr:NAD(P)/FAD-dependent oxidoreductase [Pseudoduganella dura]MUI11204.1 NAD(P)/FAD-dependent oxidoreductase [Pseudoduganella dura]GGX94046.1 NADH dehydrogenase [Pseudoduganella dura]